MKVWIIVSDFHGAVGFLPRIIRVCSSLDKAFEILAKDPFRNSHRYDIEEWEVDCVKEERDWIFFPREGK